MKHILLECEVALTHGRYNWRHDKVMRELAGVERRRKRARTNTALGEGEPATDRRKSLLNRGLDWELGVDLDRKLIFSNIVKTNLRPDVVLIVSKQSKMRWSHSS